MYLFLRFHRTIPTFLPARHFPLPYIREEQANTSNEDRPSREVVASSILKGLINLGCVR